MLSKVKAMLPHILAGLCAFIVAGLAFILTYYAVISFFYGDGPTI